MSIHRSRNCDRCGVAVDRTPYAGWLTVYVQHIIGNDPENRPPWSDNHGPVQVDLCSRECFNGWARDYDYTGPAPYTG